MPLQKTETVFIADDVELGEDVRFYGFANAYGCKIGSGSRIGPFVEIQKGASIGAKCKISSHTFICAGVTIEDECFIGHGVMFINDRYPQATNEHGELKTETDWNCEKTVIQKKCSIGSGAIIMCGITIGTESTIGAGAVVTKDVPPRSLITGVPGRLKENT